MHSVYLKYFHQLSFYNITMFSTFSQKQLTKPNYYHIILKNVLLYLLHLKEIIH